MFLKEVALSVPDNEEMPGRFNACGNNWEIETLEALEFVEIKRGEAGTSLIPFVEFLELYPKQSSLEFIEPAVEALHFIEIFFPGAVIAESANAIGEFRIIGGDGARITESTEVLSGIEAMTCGIAQGTGPFAFVARA